MKRHFAKATALLAVAALSLSACSSGASDTSSESKSGDTSSSEQTSGGEINLGVAYETTNYNPSNTSSALAMGTNWHVVEGLYEFDMTDYSVYPALAAGDPTEVSETEFEVKLRDGAKFSDGTDVTAADVVESYNRTTAEESIYKQFFDFVESVEAKDDTTVTIKTKYPFASLRERFVNVKIVPASSTEEDMTSQPIGTGPFKYESISDTEITAVPNEHYNGPNPAKVDKMHWSVLKDDSARLNAALDGTIDVMEAVPASSAEALEAAGWTIEEVEGYNNPFLMFNTAKAPFDKPEVRKAIITAIDRQRLVDSAMEGKAAVATSFLPETNPNYKKAATQFDYDTEAAKKALADAGVENLEITLVTTDHPWIANLAPQVKEDLEAAGLKVNVQSQASADVYANFTDVDNPSYDIVLAPGDPSVFGVDPGIIINWWYGDNVWTKQRDSWQATSAEKFAQLQNLTSEASQATGEEAKAKWGEAQDLIAEEAPLYPLFHRTMITAYNGEKLDGAKAIGTTGLYEVGVGAK